MAVFDAIHFEGIPGDRHGFAGSKHRIALTGMKGAVKVLND
jgi:hypothetical protein